ncbi:MAG: flagellar biosynthesis anti-sigma factor FlgM [Deltaproteobacteria bacterium]
MAGSQGPKTKKEKKSHSLVKNLERYREIFKRAGGSPNIDLKKINRLREAIRQGRYEVDFEKLAEKFLKDL